MSSEALERARDARHALVMCDEPGCTHKRGDAIKVTDGPKGRGFIAPCPRCRGAGRLPDPAFASALAELAAALAVAREREQRAVSRLEQQMDEAVARWHDNDPAPARDLNEWLGLTWDEYAAYVQGGVAALVDEPAAAGAAVPGRYQDGTDGEDSASAAADEPGETP